LETAEAAVAADTSSVDAHLARGRVLVASGRVEQAKRTFQQVLALNPRVAAARVELARLELRAGATENSVTLAAQATRQAPQRVDARIVLAKGLMVRGDYAGAEAALNEAFQAAPEEAAVHAQIGLLQVLKLNRNAARQAFTRALQLDDLQLDAIGGITSLDIAEGQRASAVTRLEGLLQRAPTNTGVLMIAARAHASLKDFSAAEALLLKVMELEPNLLDAYSLLGSVYVSQRKLEPARAQFEKVAAAQERPIAALTMIGMIHQMQRRGDEARQTFERVLSIDPRAGVAANNLAWMYAESGSSLELAAQLAETAKAALPNRAEVHDTLGWVHYKRDAFPQAIEAFQRSLELDPRSADASYHLALAYERIGDKARARLALEQYLKLDGTSSRSTEAKRRLESLGS
jgi:Tfp pilus assembly protein PilF